MAVATIFIYALRTLAHPIRRVALAIAATGLMWFASLGAYHVWPLAWIAAAPILAVAPDVRPVAAALAAFAAACLGASNLAFTYASVMPPGLLLAFVVITAFPFAVTVLAWRAVARRVHPAVAAVAYAALVVAMEGVTSTGSPNGTFGSLAYSQADVLPLLQLVSITGLWGLSFVIALVNAGAALAFRHRHERRTLLSLAALAGMPLIGVLVFGVLRLAAAAPPDQIRVGLATHDAAGPKLYTTTAGTALPVIAGYADRAARLAGGGAEVVVLPEKFVGIMPAYADAARAILSRTASDHHVTIVAGFNELPVRGTSAPPRNVAVVFDPEGRVVLQYDKVHLVPGLEEAYRPGSGVGLIDLSGVRGGVAICKDLDFSSLGRAYGQQGVALLLVPAWDFERDGWLHSRMAIVRAVENGYALARTASQGRLTVTDARGRIVAEAASSAGPEVMLTASVPTGPGGTFYSRTGDWFVWLCLVTAIACGVIARIQGRRAGSASDPAGAPTPARSPATRGLPQA